MATLTLRFTLPEEEEEARLAQHGWKYRNALWDVDQQCRQQVKHGTEPEAVKAAYQRVREWLVEALHDRGVSLED